MNPTIPCSLFQALHLATRNPFLERLLLDRPEETIRGVLPNNQLGFER